MYAIDQRCIWFAEYLKCEPSLVQTSMRKVGYQITGSDGQQRTQT